MSELLLRAPVKIKQIIWVLLLYLNATSWTLELAPEPAPDLAPGPELAQGRSQDAAGICLHGGPDRTSQSFLLPHPRRPAAALSRQ